MSTAMRSVCVLAKGSVMGVNQGQLFATPAIQPVVNWGGEAAERLFASQSMLCTGVESMDSQKLDRCGAVILCGGASARMGRDKAWLPFGPYATLLERAVAILQEVVPTSHIVVMAGYDQDLPPLPAGVRERHDSRKAAAIGPLAALMGGLACQRRHVDAAFACGCDAPLLKPSFVRRMFGLLREHDDAVVPVDAERLYPLAAVYRRTCANKLMTPIFEGERSLHRALRAHLAVRELPIDQLRTVDEELDSLMNCNTPEEYERALIRAGFA
jgi:molybdopterin-guanine dinucleotide biosynthesis protein A